MAAWLCIVIAIVIGHEISYHYLCYCYNSCTKLLVMTSRRPCAQCAVYVCSAVKLHTQYSCGILIPWLAWTVGLVTKRLHSILSSVIVATSQIFATPLHNVGRS